MPETWLSYDAAADIHARVAEPAIFAPPASGLVRSITIPPRAAVLDVGAGTGIAARLAREASPDASIVIALDPSLEMLRVARSRGLASVVNAIAPGIPFADATFDRVLANFVLAHARDYRTALLDMVRVLRAGGRLGVTAWGSVENEYRSCWQEVAALFLSKDDLSSANDHLVPWETWFTDPAHLRQAFEEVNLTGIEVHHKQYRARISIADFLEIRSASGSGRFMRQALEPSRWTEFEQTVSERFQRTFPDPIEHTRDVYIAIGTRPPGAGR